MLLLRGLRKHDKIVEKVTLKTQFKEISRLISMKHRGKSAPL